MKTPESKHEPVRMWKTFKLFPIHSYFCPETIAKGALIHQDTHMINRAMNTLLSDGKCTVLQRHSCALIGTCMANTHVGFLFIYLFIGLNGNGH